ncbi:MAG: protease HtpX [Zetaproteobacteria bacterium CG12_big_fil_rev_8_21_14_0_65_55_1124]|nr:MAG: zinc metalloprotease HtpX [Zetaproteobacteria bacterium CG1_02_55_237]PIS19517.1 MAG: protease HtpX [Zetaproteobacteria bacterium CG08_land_8_20_14_0_20_55_17]PIW42381.1 MAG: protease HtpX [Zetaproteobacteria bacterium CG12_big_fil_rev_8_21_14_0_65_55_1124]PIY52817.1 MAG: protease HtpX [Zetaproteobacteria bacterium CG_4_10_14_0_8_um_filter_55_43]PIZ38023.1 MAG: protease HtpX [Zetaproteobacteria bacterium CG_4_10_14_0_2_um_filter_55_20]PJB79120.1 MAG: protease HtpX [Zetaproteobacteria b
MRAFKGIFMLILTNLLVFLTLIITGNILIAFVLPAFGIDLRESITSMQFAWAMVFGFGGAFISLLLSKPMAKRMYKMQQVTDPVTPKEKLVYNTVQELARRDGVKMPEVWVYWDDTPNAFATGPGSNHSMVAVSSGLVNNLRDDEVQAVLAHEMGHVSNGDMVATTLLQGLMNTFVYFLAGVIARMVASAGSRDGQMNFMLYFIVNMVLQILFSILAMIVVMWHSRRREFRADAHAARHYGAEPMIRALQKIEAIASRTEPVEEESTGGGLAPQDALATMKIHGRPGKISSLFASHPPTAARIAALRGQKQN